MEMSVIDDIGGMHLLLYLKEKDNVAQDDHIHQQRSRWSIEKAAKIKVQSSNDKIIMISPHDNVWSPISSSAWVPRQ